jgi:hypothetical protein
VRDDSAVDSLTGGAGSDWFWVYGGDTDDLAAGEVSN